MYADYAYYSTTYYGNSISSADFPRYATRASDYIDSLSLTRVPDGSLDAVKKCCCALAEKFQIIENANAIAAAGELASESVGSYSRSFRSSAEIEAAAKAELGNIARMYLSKTGLLYRGGVSCVRSAHCNSL